MARIRRTKAQKLRELKLNSVEFHELSIFDKSYLKRLDEDVRFSLVIDPHNLYNFDDAHKEFIYFYMQHRNVPLAAKLSHISEEDGLAFYKEHAVREELDRLSLALYARNFSTKMLTIDELGGYLSAVLTDQVADVDKLSTKDKIPIVKMLIDLNTLKKESYENPTVIDTVKFEEEIKDMSVKTIKQMIEATYDTTNADKQNIIDNINVDASLTKEDLEFLDTLSKDELLKILADLNGDKKEKKNEN